MARGPSTRESKPQDDYHDRLGFVNPLRHVPNSALGPVPCKEHLLLRIVPAALVRRDANIGAAARADSAHAAERTVGAGPAAGEATARCRSRDAEAGAVGDAGAHAAAPRPAGPKGRARLPRARVEGARAVGARSRRTLFCVV